MVVALVEGQLETIVLPEILRQIGKGDLSLVIRDARGGSNFWRRAQRYNEAARRQVAIGLADLEQNHCASGLIKQHLTNKAHSFYLRLAVRMTESWLLADRESIASYLGISLALVPLSPDEEENPKRKLVQLASRSKRRSIREGVVPSDTGASVGTQYLPLMREYVKEH